MNVSPKRCDMLLASALNQLERHAVGFLDDLKRQAELAQAQQTTDERAFERNAALADAACHSAFRYLDALGQQLEILQPAAKAVFQLDKRHALEGLRLCEFRADVRRKSLRGIDVCEHVVLNFELRSGREFTLVKNFLPDIERLEARLRQGGAKVDSEAVRDPKTHKLAEMRYCFVADFHASVRLVPDHERGRIQFQLNNLDGFETVTVEFPAFEVGSARLDELARWLVGEPHAFLQGGQAVRRVEA